MDNASIVYELCDLRLTVMHFCVVLVDGAAVAVALHAALQGSTGELLLACDAPLANILKSCKIRYYIGLFIYKINLLLLYLVVTSNQFCVLN